MDLTKYTDYALEMTIKLLAIDSPTGYTREAAQFVLDAYRSLGYHAELTNKGCVLAEIGGQSDADGAILLAAHIDTLGAIVAEVKSDGRLRVSPLGGMNANNAEGENCHIITRSGRRYEGTLQLINASAHVNGEYDDIKRSFDTTEIVLDEPVSSAADVRALGIINGDIVAFDPRTRVTESGYIKSRFLDDKLSAGILLGMAKYYHDTGIRPHRKMYHYFTVYEEVGHGAAASIPADVKDFISMDMGCVGTGLTCTERQVSICAKDSRGPYNYDIVSGLIEAGNRVGADYAVDVYPHYGSDADGALNAGNDVRHGLIGSGVYASHGYERSHVDGLRNTLKLILAYCE